MIAVSKQKKKIENKYKWNDFNNIPMQSLLGAYHCLPLLHMAKSFISIEEKRTYS